MALFRIPVKASTPDLHLGVQVYVPTPGEILRDMWLEVVTAWNASPALADVGTFLGSDEGLYGLAADGPVDVTKADLLAGGSPGDLLVGATENDLAVAAAIGATAPSDAKRATPARFTSAAPLLVVVSQDGKNSGAGTKATVTADAAPDIAVAAHATVTAADAPTIPAATYASIVAAAAATVPTTVTEGVNDTFLFGPAGFESAWVVAPGTYETIDALQAAMLAAVGSGVTFGDDCQLANDGATLTATAGAPGSAFNGYDFLSGTNDFLADSGFSNAQALEGGADGGLVVTEGVNDTFQFGPAGHEVTYTVAPGTEADGTAVAVAMAAAEDAGSSPLSALVGVAFDAGSGKLVATAVVAGAGPNGDDFLTGATDFLADSGFSNAQALEGGADDGGATGATEGELNLYLEIEAPYPPAPWYAPTKPDAPAFPYEGKV